MKLTYRGITYERHSSKASMRPFQQVRESRAAYNLYYRGVTYRVEPHVKAKVAVEPVVYQLIYRGITYYKFTYQGTTYLVSRKEREVTAVT
jgi:YHS domain-containing protein